MKKIKFNIYVAIVLILTLSSFKLMHTYYVSICTIEYFSDSKELGISLKFTAHDIEKAIKVESNIDLHLGEKNQFAKADSMLNDYVTSRFKLKSLSNIELNYLGKEINLDETLYIYYDAKNISNFKKLEIENKLLIEVFRRQENILHLKVDGKEKSYSFNKINTKHTFLIK